MYYKCLNLFFLYFRHPTFRVKKCESILMHTLTHNYCLATCRLSSQTSHLIRRVLRQRASSQTPLGVAQSDILPSQCARRGKFNLRQRRSLTLVLYPRVPARLRLSVTSEKISIQLQHYRKLLPRSEIRAASQSKALPPTFGGRCSQQAARPRDDGQGDSATELLQEAHQRRVGHPPCALPVHLQQDVPAPAQRERAIKDRLHGGELKGPILVKNHVAYFRSTQLIYI